MTFSTSMMSQTLNVSKLALQNAETLGTAEGDSSRLWISENLFTAIYNSSEITVQIPTSDLAVLQLDEDFATQASNSYLIVGDSFIMSTAQEYSEAVEDGAALQASTFSADGLNPFLESYTLDMDEGEMTMTFSEPVNASSFDSTAITFMEGNNLAATGGDTYTMDGLAYTESNHGFSVDITLNTTNLNGLKKFFPLSTLQSNTYIQATSDTIKDMAGNGMTALSMYNGMQVSSYVADTTTPEIERFSLDMDAGEMTLEFSEVINVAELDVTEIRLQQYAGMEDGINYTLTSAASSSASDDGWKIVINIGDDDLNGIKNLYRLCTDAGTSHLVVSSDAIEDKAYAPNSVEAITNVDTMTPVSFTADSTNPVLSAYNLDMTLRELVLFFSESVFVDSLDVTQITLQSELEQGLASVDYTLTAASATASANGTSVVIDIGDADFNTLKLDLGLVTSEDLTYLIMGEETIHDMISPTPNYVTAVEDGAALTPTNFTGDAARPELTEFDMDVDTGMLSLLFSEPVDVSTLNVTGVVLQTNKARSGGSFYRLTSESTSSSADGLAVDIDVCETDLFALKLEDALCTSAGDTFLSLDTDSIFDIEDAVEGVTASNGNSAVDGAAALQAADFTSDTTSPELASFALDMDAGELDITFSEPVRASTLDVTRVTLQRTATGGDSHTLALSTGADLGSMSLSDNGQTISIDIGMDDLNALKAYQTVAASISKTFVAVTAALIDDMASNPVVAVDVAAAVQCGGFVKDTTAPTLMSFDFDSGTYELTLHFNEIVDADSMYVAGITLQPAATLGSASLTLSDATASGDGGDVVLTLGATDQDGLPSSAGTSASNTFLVVKSATVADVSSEVNQMNAITDGNGLQLGPSLYRYNLDMDAGLLSLVFSEEVDISSFTVGAITIQPAETLGDSTSYTLTDASTSDSDDGYLVEVIIGTADLEELKTRSLCVSSSTTWLVYTSSLIYDTADAVGPNAVHEAEDGAARSVHRYTEDTTSPTLVSFDLDADSGELTLNFDEPILASSVDAAHITLHNASLKTNSTESYTLTSGSVAASDDGTVVVVTIEQGGGADQDMDFVRLLPNLAVDAASTFLQVGPLAFSDMALLPNAVVPIDSSSAMAVTSFTIDSTDPELLTFAMDMNALELTLTFTEAVSVAVFDVTQITMQGASAYADGVERFVLTNSSALAEDSTDSAVVVVSLGQDDANDVKERGSLCTSAADTFVVLSTTLTNDVSPYENPFYAIESDAARQVTAYTTDTTSPVLQSFELDMNTGELFLHFEEIVASASVDVGGVTLQYAVYTGTQNKWVLTNTSSSCSSDDGLTMVIDIGDDDLNAIKVDAGLAVALDSTYLVLTPATLVDMAGNAVEQITDGNAMQASSLGADTTQPEVLGFSVWESGIMQIFFSETIDASSLNQTGFMLQATQDGTNTYSLTATTTLRDDTVVGTTYLDVDVSDDLFDAQRAGCCYAQTNTYLVAFSAAVFDMAPEPNALVYTGSGIRAGPFVKSFALDMDEGDLTITFSETVMANTTFDVAGLVLQSSADGAGESFALTTSVVSLTDSDVIAIALSTDDQFGIKLLRDLAISSDSTYLSTDSEVTVTYSTDLNLEDAPVTLVDIDADDAATAGTYVADTTAPVLESYTLDMDEALLSLVFTEPVSSLEFNVTDITIQSAQTYTPFESSYTLTDSTTASGDSEEFVIDLGETDVAYLQLESGLAVSAGTTFLLLPPTVALDLASPCNRLDAVVDGAAQQASTFVADTTSPSLIEFEMDLDAGYILLTFDETIDSASIDTAGITLQGSADSSDTDAVTLTASTIPRPSDDPKTIELDLATYYADLTTITLNTQVATSSATTWLSLDASAASDFALVPNSVSVIADSAAIQCASFRDDTTAPNLLSYSLDLVTTSANYQSLTLVFDEPMLASSFDVSQITLQDEPTLADASESITLSATESAIHGSQANAKTIVIVVDGTDLTTLEGFSTLGATQSDTFLTLTSGLATDMAGSANSVVAVADGAAQASGPVLQGYSLDMDAGEVELRFSEVMDTSTLDTTALTIHGVSDGSGASYEITTNSTLKAGSDALAEVVTLSLGKDDVEALKLDAALATTVDNTFLAISSALLYNDLDTPLHAVEIDAAAPRQVDEYTADSSAPTIYSFQLDMDAEFLIMTSNEPINASSVDVTKLTVQNNATRATEARAFASETVHYTLTTSSSVISNNSVTVIVKLGADDLTELKLLLELAVSEAETFLVMDYSAMVDMAAEANTNSLIDDANALAVSQFAPDVSAPTLLSFTLNLDSGTLALTFSEAVLASTLDVTGIRLQQFRTQEFGASYTLTDSDTSSTNGLVITVDLSATDVYEINSRSDLAYSEASVYLIVDGKTIHDMNGNNVTSIVDGSAMAVANFALDTTSPSLLEFELDMDTGVMNLRFTEMILASSFIATQLRFQSESYDDESTVATYALTGATTTANKDAFGNAVEIDLQIAQTDVDGLKDLPGLGFDLNSTWLTVGSVAFTDMSGNSIEEIETSAALGASLFTADSTTPSLVYFNLDMDEGILDLAFSETVELTTADVPGIRLQEHGTLRHGSGFTLTGASAVSENLASDGSDAYVIIGDADLNLIKLLGACSSLNTTYLTLEQGSFRDMVQLDVDWVLDGGIEGGAALKASAFTADTTAPVLDSFLVEQSERALYLFFSEAVASAGLALDQLVIANSSTHNLALPADLPFTAATDGTEIRVDLNETWQALESMSLLSLPIYLSVDRTDGPALADPAGNELQEVTLQPMGAPDCSACPDGTFLSSACTATHGRQCSACSVCPEDHFVLKACNTLEDAQCYRCSECQQGEYEVSACGEAGNDRSCAVCTVCGAMEYETRNCEYGLDRICGSCEDCLFSDAQEKGCRGQPLTWRMENCCYDSEGEQVSCKSLAYANVEITARNGRRHWVFDSTTPAIEGYSQADWSEG